MNRWYKGLAPKTRVYMGVGVMAWAGLGMFLTDKAEEKFDLVPTEADKRELARVMPRIIPVDKEKR